MDEILTRVNVLFSENAEQSSAKFQNNHNQPITIQTSIHTYTQLTCEQTSKQTNQNIKLRAAYNKRGKLNNLINWFDPFTIGERFVSLYFVLLAISAHFHWKCRFKGPPHTHTQNTQNWLNLEFGFYSYSLDGQLSWFSIELKIHAKFGGLWCHSNKWFDLFGTNTRSCDGHKSFHLIKSWSMHSHNSSCPNASHYTLFSLCSFGKIHISFLAVTYRQILFIY